MNGEVFTGGATTSQHVDAQDDDHFENTTFKLKRTRSLGLLDEFIQPMSENPDAHEGDDHKHADDESKTVNYTNEYTKELTNSQFTTNEQHHEQDEQSNEHDRNANDTHDRQQHQHQEHQHQSSQPQPSQQPQQPQQHYGYTPQIHPQYDVPVSPQNFEHVEHAEPSNAEQTHSAGHHAGHDDSQVADSVPESEDVQQLDSYKSPELLPHDDTDLSTEPSQHVDYLSYQWDVSDISKSWRYIISKRKDVANSARLENASWRTWAQRRGNLKTISPEVVNWSKDSDVTWLYGPILQDRENTDKENVDSSPLITIATSAVAGDISISKAPKLCNAPKPILKHRTVQDKMISHSNLLKLQLATNKLYQMHREKLMKEKVQREEAVKRNTRLKHPDFDDYDAISAKLNSQYKNISTEPQSSSQSNSLVNLQNLVKRNSSNNLNSTLSKTAHTSGKPSFTMHDREEEEEEEEDQKEDTVDSAHETNTSHQQLDSVLTLNTDAGSDVEPQVVSPLEESPEDLLSVKKSRHIRFNDIVKQCIAVDTYSDDEYLEGREYNDYGLAANEYDDEFDVSPAQNDYAAYSQNSANSLYVDSSYDNSEYNADIDDYDDDDDDDDEGGFFLKVKSPTTPSNAIPALSSKSAKEPDITDDTESISTNNSKVYRTIELLPSTNINYGSSDESSDDENPYTSSVSHGRGNSTRGYDYYYDYNTVYTGDPNHAIYGKKAPDVCDVPENITVGSNIDYHDIETGADMPIIFDSLNAASTDAHGVPASAIPGGHIDAATGHIDAATGHMDVAAGGLHNSVASVAKIETKPVVPSRATFGNVPDSDSDSDSDSDNGLSIGARSSSQSLAQQVFGLSTYPENYPQPVDAPVSSINPRFSSTSLSKQPSSSNSLSGSFFGGGGNTGMTKQKDSSLALSQSFLGSNLTRQKPSSGSLSSVFLGGATGLTRKSSSALADSFFAPAESSKVPTESFNAPAAARSASPRQRSLSNTQSKSSPLPPQTTSTNAFPLSQQQKPPARVSSSKTFDFDSDSDEEPMTFGSISRSSGNSIANPSSGNPGPGNSSSSVATPSYTSLSQVAGKSGIRSPSPEAEPRGNLVGQAKGLANHFLGSWKNNTEDHET